jgi:hypothetical protein
MGGILEAHHCAFWFPLLTSDKIMSYPNLLEYHLLSRVCSKKFFSRPYLVVHLWIALQAFWSFNQDSGMPYPIRLTASPLPHFPTSPLPHFPTSPLPHFPLCHNYSYILCAFCQKNFFFAIKLHKKKIIVVG